MDDDTPVNHQISDAITQANVKVLEITPAMAMGQLYQTTSNALENNARQRDYPLRQAVTSALVRQALESAPEEAMKIIEPHPAGDDVAETKKGGHQET